MGAHWQQAQKLTVPAAGSATFDLALNCPLERVTIWAISGKRVLTNMTFQLRINEHAYNPPLVIVADEALDVVYRSGGASAENDLLPFIHARDRATLDPFDISVLVSNGGGAEEKVTIFAVGIQHQG